MQGLPSVLNVEKYAEARAFEIDAMERAMQNARSNATQRAWQQLPRHLRRRAASHDVRRVPSRLREKARSEMDPARPKAKYYIPKRSRKGAISRTQQLLKRQVNKTWLETHIWHAKRMHMEDMWGYRLAVTPTEKAFRPSHRASVHGSILHDASYYALLEVKGPEDILCVLLDSCCDHQGPRAGSKRFLAGSRTCETHIYAHNAYPFDLIGPATVIWEPRAPDSGYSAAQTMVGSKRKQKGKGKNTGHSEAPSLTRKVWIRVHPAVTTEVFHTLHTAASFALDAAKKAAGGEFKADVEVADLRENVNVYEIMGPKSSQVIKGALKPLCNSEDEEFKAFWNSLDHLQSSGSLSRGMIVGFSVHDPRLSFPPKNQKIDYESQPPSSQVYTFPSASLASSAIWDDATRSLLRKPKYKKMEIDKRRSANLIPGRKLTPTDNDNVVPVMLIQRSVESPTISTSSSNYTSDSASLHGWTLIVPSGWAMPFFSSLIYTGTRIAGQRERATQAFESGCAYFPRDYPTTDAYDAFATERGEEEAAKWERTPPAKRVNYAKLGTRSPWQPDWTVVLGLEETDFVSTQREDTAASQVDAAVVEPWLLRGADIASKLFAVPSQLDTAVGLLEYIDRLRTDRGQGPLGTHITAKALWNGALVMVRLLLRGRGKPADMAHIYILDDSEARQWLTAEELKKGRDHIPEEVEDETELSKIVPSPDSIIGYVTAGDFSLTLGEGHAIGSIPLRRFVELKRQADRLRTGSTLLVKVRNREGNICRAAHLEVLP
ncbi:POP1-domain-containing protein [Wolfiporia cocos MD-104 SS10]|uniref:POP1-domain-containing protein n=1 Tax=Wolfiporia cocos (strain MD-104) TaxID=742152 RepID=A0A2H3JVR2_WOLCO|nr:POP1-domain-containing protein [Wolfiporia cocos MD-104 SS10]